jgi:hypothetical protein
MSTREQDAPFEEGDVVEGTWRTKAGDETRRVRVNWVERREDGWYFGYVNAPGERHVCAWGAATARDEPKPFGLVAFRVLSRAVLP